MQTHQMGLDVPNSYLLCTGPIRSHRTGPILLFSSTFCMNDRMETNPIMRRQIYFRFAAAACLALYCPRTAGRSGGSPERSAFVKK